MWSSSALFTTPIRILESETGQTDIDLEPGLHHLDGKFALWYVRSRWSTSDFDRHRRQQQVLVAIFRRARSAEMLLRVPELWSTYQQSVETDLGLREMLSLALGGCAVWTTATCTAPSYGALT